MINQKGMEMAIQIFVVLFVLLAVAMLVLQLVSRQFEEQGSQLDKQQREAQFKQNKSQAQVKCQSYCNRASEADLVSYCTETFNLSAGAGSFVNYNQKDFLPGIGVCEDKVYCPLLSPCKLGNGTELTMSSCKQILCSYWKKQFGDDNAGMQIVNRKMVEFLDPGACYSSITGTEKNDHWFILFYGGNPSCSS